MLAGSSKEPLKRVMHRWIKNYPSWKHGIKHACRKHLVIFGYCLMYTGYHTRGLDRYHVLCSRRAWPVELDLFCHSHRSKYSVTPNSKIVSQQACSHPWYKERCVFEVSEVIYQTREAAFHRDIQTPRSRLFLTKF